MIKNIKYITVKMTKLPPEKELNLTQKWAEYIWAGKSTGVEMRHQCGQTPTGSAVGVVLKMGCWCCFGENDSICAMVEPFRWCFQRCQKCFWDVYSNSSLLEKMISYIKNPSWTSSLFCGMLCVKEGEKNMAKEIPSLHSYKDGIFLLYHIKKFILLECILSMVCILYLQRHLIWFPSNYFYI